ncbi:MAG: response regulator [Angelakisella sp.]|nr:response regulator [Angelakisella sp.]
MELYRVLLVDDEEDIRVGISRKMDWEALGFVLVCEAENGQEALELAEQYKPDVILTDIKMPFMDGLELCRILTNRLPASKFVIFSGFDEFDYAKQAISMNVFEYILKPINAAELSDVLQKLKTQIDTERAQRRDMDTLRRRYEESLPLLRELFYSQLIEGKIRTDQMQDRAARYDLDLRSTQWVSALVQIDDAGEDSELIPLSVQQFFDDNMKLKGCICRTFLYNDSVALIASMDNSTSIYDLIEEINRICKLAKSYLRLTLTVGVGSVCHTPCDLRRSAAGARSALDYRVLAGAGRVIYIGDMEPNQRTKLSFEDEDKRDLINAVKLGIEEDVALVVDRLISRIGEAGLALSQCHFYFLTLLTCLLTITRNADLEMEEVFGPGFSGAVQITDFGSTVELRKWFLHRCLKIHELLRQQRTDSTWRLIEKAKAFIQQNYAQSELSVESLCEHLHLSSAYFSTLFKRETGMSFTGYVTEVRMEAAAALLRDTEEKTYLIAEKTGYQDPNYFSYVFKKHFGVSPTKYRTR